MKYIIFILFFNSITIPTLLGMDFDKETNLSQYLTPKSSAAATSSFSYKETLASINKQINESIPTGIWLTKSPDELTEKEYLNLIKIIENNHTKIDKHFVNDLARKNSYFSAAIGYFIKLASKNFDKVTCATLDTIRHCNNQQPTPGLNLLPLTIKSYVMKSAFKKIERPYKMVFSGHTRPIISRDVNTKGQVAATASHDEKFYIWNLAEGRKLYKLPQIAYFGQVKFNADGTLLATVTYLEKQPSIDVWDITIKQQPQEPTHTIPFDKSIHHTHVTNVAFFKNNLAVYGSNWMSLYALEKNKEVNFLGTQYPCEGREQENTFGNIDHLWNVDHSWNVTRNNPFLYLAEKAVKNTVHATSLSSLANTKVYKELLTPYERDLLKPMLAQKGISN